MQYPCEGCSRPYIDDTLYLSENRVRTDWSCICSKLDVHNKQGLLDCVRGE